MLARHPKYQDHKRQERPSCLTLGLIRQNSVLVAYGAPDAQEGGQPAQGRKGWRESGIDLSRVWVTVIHVADCG